MMLNVVADKEGVSAAVLIRSCVPIGGAAFLCSINLILFSFHPI
jgi:3-methyladenine DNA glycosylase Mpg